MPQDNIGEYASEQVGFGQNFPAYFLTFHVGGLLCLFSYEIASHKLPCVLSQLLNETLNIVWDLH